jgi:hypothetical protein
MDWSVAAALHELAFLVGELGEAAAALKDVLTCCFRRVVRSSVARSTPRCVLFFTSVLLYAFPCCLPLSRQLTCSSS